MTRLSVANRYRHLQWLIDLVASPFVQNPDERPGLREASVLKASL